MEDQGAQAVISLFKSLSDASVSGSSVQGGQRLLNALTVLLIAWTGIKMMLEFEPIYSAMANLVKTAILWGFASFMIGTAAGGGIFGEIQNGMKSIATSVAPQGTNGDQFVVMGKMVDSATKIWLGPKRDSASTGSSSGSQGSSGGAQSSGGLMGWLGLSAGESILENLLFGILSVITRFFVGVFVLISGLLYFGSMIVAQVMFKIAAIMMPFMLPWIMFEQTNFIFDGWLKFTITAGLQIIVANIIYGLTLGVVDKVVEMVAGINGNPSQEYLVYAAALLITGIMAYVMLQVSSIANGLLSGSARGSWTPGGKLSPGGGSTAVSNSIKSGAQKAGSVANSAAGGVAGSLSGRSNGGGFKGAMRGGAQGWSKGAAGMAKEALGIGKTAANKATPTTTSTTPSASPVQQVRAKLQQVRENRR